MTVTMTMTMQEKQDTNSVLQKQNKIHERLEPELSQFVLQKLTMKFEEAMGGILQKGVFLQEYFQMKVEIEFHCDTSLIALLLKLVKE